MWWDSNPRLRSSTKSEEYPYQSLHDVAVKHDQLNPQRADDPDANDSATPSDSDESNPSEDSDSDTLFDRGTTPPARIIRKQPARNKKTPDYLKDYDLGSGD